MNRTLLLILLLAVVSSFELQAQPTNPCIPVGEDACEDAPILNLCQLDGWMSDTDPDYVDYTPGSTIPQVGWCNGSWSIENNQWLGFVAETDMVILGVDISECNASAGIQIAAYEVGQGGPCVGDQLSCIGFASGENSSFNYNIWGLTVGETYLIMIDGFGGDGCPFTFRVVHGADNPVTAVANALPICPGLPSYTALNGVGTVTGPGIIYEWTTEDGYIEDGEDTLFPVISEPGTYTLTVIDPVSCCLNSVTVEVPENTDFPEAVATVDVNSTIDGSGILSCINPDLTLTAEGSDGGGVDENYYYQWYDPDGNDIALAYELEGVDEPGEYTLGVLNIATGCYSETTVEVEIDTLPPMVDPLVDNVLDCINSDIPITGNGSSNVTYQWEGPNDFTSAAENPDAPLGGEYFVTVTSEDNGCTNTGSVIVSTDTIAPVVSTVGGLIDCTNTTVDISASSPDAAVTFEWSGVGFTDSGNQVNVSSAEEYTVVATAANGCTSVTTALVESNVVPPSISATVNDVLTCTNTQVQLDGGSQETNVSYGWSSADGSSAFTDEDPMVSAATTYTLTVTNLDNNCTSTATVDVVEDIIPPDVNTSVDDVLDCVTTQVSIGGTTSTSNATYEWTGAGSLSDASIANPNVNTAGQYTLTVTGENGCTATSSITVDEDLNEPTANAGQDGILTCQDTETTIDGSASSSGGDFSYQWFNSANSPISADVATQVNNAGIYTLIVTNSTNGCTAEDQVEIGTDENVPVANAGAPQVITCLQDEVMLDGTASTAGATISYQWLDGSGSPLSTDMTVPTSIPGTYTLLVSDSSNGCETQAQVEVSDNTTDPLANAGTPQTITCTAPQVTIDGSASSGTGTIQYLWTDASGATVSTSATFDVSDSGTYDLLVTNDDNGCTAISQVVIDEDTALPVASAGNPSTITCVESEATLDGTASSGNNLIYEWTAVSSGEIVGDIASLQTEDPDTYNLLVTNTANGCTDSDQVVIDVDADFPVVDVGQSTTLTCDVLEATLDGTNSSGGTNLVFEWQDANGSMIESEAITTISEPGTYTLVVTNLDNDCVADEEIVIPQEITAPDADAGADQIITCDITEVALDGTASSTGAEYTYAWVNEGNVDLGDTPTISVSTPGTYTLMVTNTSNGCTSEASALVEPDENIPDASVNLDGILTCQNTEVNIDNIGSTTGGTITYTWTDKNDATIGESGNITVETPGVYNMLVTNTENGCTNQASIQVEQNIQEPVSNPGASPTLTCSITTVQLDGSASSANEGSALNYEWTNENTEMVGSTAMIDVTTSGDYTLLVTDMNNGCTASEQVAVLLDVNEPTPDAGVVQTLTCANTTAELNAMASSGAGNLTFEWQNTNNSSIATEAVSTVDAPDTYTVIVTDDSNGCTATASVQISQDIMDPTPAIADPNMLTCTVESVMLDGSESQGVDLTYEWQNNGNVVVGTTASVSVNEAGVYTLNLIDNSNGCTASMQTEVLPDENLPAAAANVDDMLTCVIEEVTLSNTGSSTGTNFSYAWQSPVGTAISSDEMVVVDAPGTYSLMVTDNNNGCTSEASVEVMIDNEDPSAVIDQNVPLMTCDIESVVLDGSASEPAGVLDFVWQNSGGVQISTLPMPEVDNVDDYMLIVTNVENGCTNTALITVNQDEDVPVVMIPTPNTINCYNPSVEVLSTGSSTGDFTYEWRDENGNLISNDLNIEVSEGGIYELTLINNENGCDNANSTQVNIDQEEPVALADVDDILDCITPSVELNSTGSSVGTAFDYEWSGPAGGLQSANDVPNPEVTLAGDYELLVTNTDNGCTALRLVTVEENTAEPNAGVIGAADPSCFGFQDGLIQVDEIVGGTPPYSYSINGEAYTANTNYVNLGSGDYMLEVEDASGCTWDTLLNLVNPVQIDVELGPDLVVQLGETIDLNAAVNVETDTVNWVGIDSLSCEDCLTQTLTPTQSGLYEITVFDENGCVDTDEIFLRVEIVRPVYVPNAFSPGDDNGTNDGFTVFTKADLVKEVRTLVVADRWGEIVFTKNNFQPNDPALGWDGTFKGKTLNPQVLVWYTEVEFIDGVVLDYKGDVTIMK